MITNKKSKDYVNEKQEEGLFLVISASDCGRRILPVQPSKWRRRRRQVIKYHSVRFLLIYCCITLSSLLSRWVQPHISNHDEYDDGHYKSDYGYNSEKCHSGNREEETDDDDDEGEDADDDCSKQNVINQRAGEYMPIIFMSLNVTTEDYVEPCVTMKKRQRCRLTVKLTQH